MKSRRSNGGSNFVAAAVVGALAALVIIWIVTFYREKDEIGDVEDEADFAERYSESLAVKYAEAVKRGDCETIIEKTWWMQESLEVAFEEVGDALDTEEFRGKLCEGATVRNAGENVLTSSGIEDKYLLTPGVEIVPVDADEGGLELARPVGERVWLRLRYPTKLMAPLDSDGNRIREITVGVNISRDGFVLKAEVMGNLEVNWDSVSLDWPNTEEIVNGYD